MKSSTCNTSVFLFCALTISSAADADAWNCSHTDLVREVLVEYPEGGTVPCNVVYKKAMEGFTDQVLWSASNEQGYCEEKAREFVGKLESWGWDCAEPETTDVADVETDPAPEVEPEQALQSESELIGNPESKPEPEHSAELQSGVPTDTSEPDADKIQ
jgi:hypothetical protein